MAEPGEDASMLERDALDEDDLDPLAPIIYGSEDASDDVDPEEDCYVPAADFGSPEPETELDPDQLEADGGTSDPENIVRVWLDEGRLTRVRVSPQWANKVGRRRLGDIFAQAFAFAYATVPPVPGPEAFQRRTFDLDPDQVPAFGGRALAAVMKLTKEVDQKIAGALEARADRPEPAPGPITEGRSKGVTVSLDDRGLVHRVVFDEAWLGEAQAGQICTHVVQAAQNAYGRYVPRQPEEDTELDSLMEERDFYTAVLKAMLNPKER